MSNYPYNDFFQGTFVDAVFARDDRKIISAVFLNQDGERFAYHIEADINQPAYVELMKFVTPEELEQWTRDQLAEDRKVLLTLAFEEAKNQGYEISNDVESIVLDKIFQYNPEEHTEFLFKFKLKAFESPLVANCTDEDLRVELRDSLTPMDAIDVLRRIKLTETTGA